MDNRNKRILITLSILILSWIIGYIPVPGIAAEYASTLPQGFSSMLTVLSLGLMPFISANTIILLLSVVMPYFKNIAEKDGLNSQKINKAVWGTTLILSVIQSIFISLWMQNSANIGTIPPISIPSNLFLLIASLTITAGVFLLLWLAHLISKYGIGNGISLLILLPFVVGGIKNLINIKMYYGQSFLAALGIIIFLIVVIKYSLGIRKNIDVQFEGNNENKTTMKIPLSIPGIIPIYFASSIALFPVTLASFSSSSLLNKLQNANPVVSWSIFAVLVIFLTYFVTAAIFNPINWANRMKNVGLRIPNVEQGQKTAEYMDAIMTRFMIKWAGLLIGIALIWRFIPYWIKIPHFSFGVESLILIIGVCIAVGKSLSLKSHYKKVYVHNDFGEVLIIETLLKTNGIDCVVEYAEEYARYISLLVVGSFGEKRVLVKESDFDRAKEIVSALPVYV